MTVSKNILESQIETKKGTLEKGAGFDLAIIGGGPAGLAAGIYAGRSELKTVLIEEAIFGGMVNSIFNLENYPGCPRGIKGIELIQRMSEQVKDLGLETIFAYVSRASLAGPKKLIFTQDGKTISARAVIIATGTKRRELGVPGEKEFLGRGISYCAICDGPLFAGKNIAVVGGGDAAIEEALYLSSFASSVTIVHRKNVLRAAKILEKAAFQNSKVHFLWDSEVKEFQGREKLEKIVIFNKKENKELSLNFDGAFIYIGSLPASHFIVEAINKDENGFLITDELMTTSIPGVFAAGDIRQKPLRQVVTAAADGAVAAISAYNYLRAA